MFVPFAVVALIVVPGDAEAVREVEQHRLAPAEQVPAELGTGGELQSKLLSATTERTAGPDIIPTGGPACDVEIALADQDVADQSRIRVVSQPEDNASGLSFLHPDDQVTQVRSFASRSFVVAEHIDGRSLTGGRVDLEQLRVAQSPLAFLEQFRIKYFARVDTQLTADHPVARNAVAFDLDSAHAVRLPLPNAEHDVDGAWGCGEAEIGTDLGIDIAAFAQSLLDLAGISPCRSLRVVVARFQLRLGQKFLVADLPVAFDPDRADHVPGAFGDEKRHVRVGSVGAVPDLTADLNVEVAD